MIEMADFMKSALPWTAIGLYIAFFCVKEHARNNNINLSVCFISASMLPIVGFLALAILEMSEGKNVSGTTWFVLAIVNSVLCFSNRNEQVKENGEEDTQ